MRTEQIHYRLKNGIVIDYLLDTDRGLTLEDVNNVSNMCVEAFQNPKKVFIRIDLYAELMKTLASNQRYYGSQYVSVGIDSFKLDCGFLTTVAIANSYIPFLVGDDEDFADNDFYKVFEEAVNG